MNRKNNNYFVLFFLVGLSCGSVFGMGLSVALKNILLLPVFISTGTAIGAFIGIMVKNHYKNKKG